MLELCKEENADDRKAVICKLMQLKPKYDLMTTGMCQACPEITHPPPCPECLSTKSGSNCICCLYKNRNPMFLSLVWEISFCTDNPVRQWVYLQKEFEGKRGGEILRANGVLRVGEILRADDDVKTMTKNFVGGGGIRVGSKLIEEQK